MSDTEPTPKTERFKSLFASVGLTLEQDEASGNWKAVTEDGDEFWYRLALNGSKWVVDPYPSRGSLPDKFTLSLADFNEYSDYISFDGVTFWKSDGRKMENVEVKVTADGITVTETY